MLNAPYQPQDKCINVVNYHGLVGSALTGRLKKENPAENLTVEREEVDLIDQVAVNAWMAKARRDAVFVLAAKVGGILANDTNSADFLHDNLMIADKIQALGWEQSSSLEGSLRKVCA